MNEHQIKTALNGVRQTKRIWADQIRNHQLNVAAEQYAENQVNILRAQEEELILKLEEMSRPKEAIIRGPRLSTYIFRGWDGDHTYLETFAVVTADNQAEAEHELLKLLHESNNAVDHSRMTCQVVPTDIMSIHILSNGDY